MDDQKLGEALKRHFGHERFRPGQRRIVELAIAGHDQLILMPTGGGKSLTYQLPALLLPGLTVVVSPLIALMHDQVDRLRENGIAATFLNSTLAAGERTRREQAIAQGRMKLLYLSPERLLSEECLAFLEYVQRQGGLSLLAVDEAHCVSEWGHDFRPEYRQLAAVRERFAALPTLALTATATERVRQDILVQLKLRDPHIHIASFDRPNLHYAVLAKDKGAYAELLGRLRRLDGASAIVYCQSRRAVEALAERLVADGLNALPYHAGMAAEMRSRHQTQFLRDDAPVLVATVAFGMGIAKPDVRAVFHYELPRNLEGYYQESGRAGRDGQPADCVLFFSPGDRAKIEYLVAQKSDPHEQRLARSQLAQMLAYAESTVCRRRILLGYFGEALAEADCGGCDNCRSPVATQDRTVDAQKLLSCVARCQERFGLRHIAQVLRGANTQKIRTQGHDRLSTYGIGADLSQAEWLHLGRTLVHQGLLIETTDGYPVLKLNALSWEVLRRQRTVTAARLPARPTSPQPADAAADDAAQGLFEHLRRLRKRLADEQNVPPYVVFADAALKAMAQRRPQTMAQFLAIPGVGTRKAEAYFTPFTAEIRTYCEALALAPEPAHGEISPPEPPRRARSPQPAEVIPSTCALTLDLWRQGLTVEQIAERRSLRIETIEGHLAELVESGEDIAIERLVGPDRRRTIEAVLLKLGTAVLKPVKEQLGDEYSYGEIRLVRAQLLGGHGDF
ncbi:DNA helicase RecQ [Gloeobacter violaceus]|uniref:DNA helicase RecQ n=1 Tax=Gloeobacter violaceus TaxID=33072 RepID=UPI0002D72A88|nr:DNA helicase RecQ [Gloeobacter violaceus]